MDNYYIAIGLGGLELDFSFKQDKTAQVMVMAAVNNGAKAMTFNADLVRPFVPYIANILPHGFSVSLNEFSFAFVTESHSQEKAILGEVDLGISFSLSSLPLVGKFLGSDFDIGLEGITILLSDRAYGENEQDLALLNSIASASPPHILKLPDNIDKGANFKLTINVAGNQKEIFIDLDSGPTSSTSNTSLERKRDTHGLDKAVDSPPATRTAEEVNHKSLESEGHMSAGRSGNSEITWVDIKKSIGPARFERIGGQYQNEQLHFFIDASLTLGPVTMKLIGLRLSSRLDKFSPSIGFDGLALDYSDGAVEISGGLSLRDGQYRGSVVIKAETFTITGLAVYDSRNQSLFIFANLDYILGGPPLFFVTGLAAGFGVNRRMTIPNIDEVGRFPLLKFKTSDGQLQKSPSPLNTLQELEEGNWISVKKGDYFLAFGVQFTSFKLVDSEALLIASVSDKFRLNLVGSSSLSLPKKAEKKYCNIIVDLVAEVVPEDGYAKVDGLIRHGSYVIDKDCQVYGGFAFYFWFANKHAGDFVFTLGGYHPKFNVPSHYPVVPRLGFHWPVSKKITIQGESYFALTPSAVMAGGRLNAVYQSGRLRAWFKVSADFLVRWEPFMFDAQMSVSIGASYTVKVFGYKKTLGAELGATLHLWGPPTAGKVKIKWFVISFTVSFGKQKMPQLEALDWDQFTKLLPPVGTALKSSKHIEYQQQEVLKILLQSGLLSEGDADEEGEMADEVAEGARWYVRPDEFAFTARSYVPATSLEFNDQDDHRAIKKYHKKDASTSFRIRPMHVQKASAKLVLTLRDDKGKKREIDWQVTALKDNLPDALWGDYTDNNLNRAPTIEQQLIGLQIQAPSAKAQRSIEKTIDDLGVNLICESHIRVDFPAKNEIYHFRKDSDEDQFEALLQRQQSSNVQTVASDIAHILQDADLYTGSTKPLQKVYQSPGYFIHKPMQI